MPDPCFSRLLGTTDLVLAYLHMPVRIREVLNELGKDRGSIGMCKGWRNKRQRHSSAISYVASHFLDTTVSDNLNNFSISTSLATVPHRNIASCNFTTNTYFIVSNFG